jgi:hypothetical protein
MLRVTHTRACRAFVILSFALILASAARAQGTSFTYQGRLTDGGAPANANYDLQFTLWDASVGGTQQPQPVPPTLTKTNVPVTGGVFSVLLDFGVSAFPGADRFLEVGVRPGGVAGGFTILSPRQQISSTPYALRTLSATAADSLSSACVGCVQDAQINSVAASKLTGTLPAASLPPDSASYVQNRTTPQTNSTFNISGNGVIGGDLTVTGKINASISGNFIQNGTVLQNNANFNISGNGIVGGNVGIGASNPASKLDVRGHLLLDPNASPIIYTSSTAGEQNRFLQLINSPSTPNASGLKAGGILVADSYSFANPGKNDLIVKGRVGIGTATPNFQFEVNTALGSYGFVHSTPSSRLFPAVRVGSYAGAGTGGATGGWLGTLSNDQLHFFVGGGGPSMTVDTNGNVGIGTTSPTQKLTVRTPTQSYGLFHTDGQVGVGTWVGPSTACNGSPFIGCVSAGWFGTTSNHNLNFFTNNGSATLTLGTDGNLSQPRTRNGLVKALLVVNENGTIARCYNSQSGASSENCGFSIRNDLGQYLITFPFQVSDRFATATPNIESGRHKVGLNLAYGGSVGLSTSQIAVLTFYTDTSRGTGATDPTNAPFTLVVY